MTGQWIPCSVRFPCINVNVLLCDEDGDIYVGFLSDSLDENLVPLWVYDDFRIHAIDAVKAWQPLPEPYKES